MSDRIKELQAALRKMSDAENNNRRLLKMSDAENNNRRLLKELYEDLKAAQVQAFAGLFDSIEFTEVGLFIRVVDRPSFGVTVMAGSQGYETEGSIAHEKGLNFPTMWAKVRDFLASEIYSERVLQRVRMAVERAEKEGRA